MVYVVCFEFLLVECDLTLDSDFHQNAVCVNSRSVSSEFWDDLLENTGQEINKSHI